MLHCKLPVLHYKTHVHKHKQLCNSADQSNTPERILNMNLATHLKDPWCVCVHDGIGVHFETSSFNKTFTFHLLK